MSPLTLPTTPHFWLVAAGMATHFGFVVGRGGASTLNNDGTVHLVRFLYAPPTVRHVRNVVERRGHEAEIFLVVAVQCLCGERWPKGAIKPRCDDAHHPCISKAGLGRLRERS